MAIEAKVITDSVNSTGNRITTFVLTYPRFIHAEVLTHRMFSRNASSSRAIPTTKLIESVRNNPAAPIHWGKNQAGMQAYEEHPDPSVGRQLWEEALGHALEAATLLNQHGYHKQVVNRLLEPFSHITVVLTATEFDNFFALRYHEAAQPEIQALAKAMYEARQESHPQLLRLGEWHLPFISDEEKKLLPLQRLIIKSVASCARVSYNNHDNTTPTDQQNRELYDRLLGANPKHCSPAEHQATPSVGDKATEGNFNGWTQYRKTLPAEHIDKFNPPQKGDI